MKTQEFNELLEERIKKIKETLIKKAFEYETKTDKLHNFKAAAVLSSTTPEKALWGMAMKHLVSITDIINGNLENSRNNIDEKLGDMINYLILLEALFEDIRTPA